MAAENSDTIKHLEMIQAVISRMASNSFLLKGWSVTLVAAIVALAAQGTSKWFILLAQIPALAFWCLDAYYLLRERLFRHLYEDVRSSLDGTSTVQEVKPFSMDVSKYPTDFGRWKSAFLSPSELAVHGMLSLSILVLAVVLVWLVK